LKNKFKLIISPKGVYEGFIYGNYRGERSNNGDL